MNEYGGALRFNVRETTNEILEIRDEVYYKRNNNQRWHGPGTVIGKAGKLVLVRYGGVYVTVHLCRPTRLPVSNNDSEDFIGDEGLPSQQCKDRKKDERSLVKVEDNDCECEEGIKANSRKCHKNDSEKDRSEALREEELRSSSNIRQPLQTPKPGMGKRFKAINSETGERLSGDILSRAGKATGKYKDCYNIRNDSDGSIDFIELKNLEDFEHVEEDVEMLIIFNDSDVKAATELERKN